MRNELKCVHKEKEKEIFPDIPHVESSFWHDKHWSVKLKQII